jgi:hypothetical protein
VVQVAKPLFPPKGLELATVWGLSEKFSTPEAENCTLIVLSEPYSKAAKPPRNRMPRTESPKIGHVRVCGGSGEVTPRFYPALFLSIKIYPQKR